MTRQDAWLASKSSSATGQTPQWLTSALIGWALLRLIALVIVLYALKDWILDKLGELKLTLLVIGLASTPVARSAFFLLLGGLLTALCHWAMRTWPRVGYWIAAGAAAVLVLALFYTCDTPLLRALPVVALLAANLLPDRLFERILPTSRQRGVFMALAVGAAELFFFRRFLAWVAELWIGRPIAVWRSLPASAVAAFLASGAASLLLLPTKLVAVEQSLRMPAQARIVARGDFNWMEMDASARHLFVTGHGVPRLLRFEVADLGREPQAVSVDTGRAQAFTQDQQAGEIYIYNGLTRELLTFDTGTLRLKNSFPVKGLASGDPWLVADPRSNSIVVVSEADANDGVAFLTLDRTSGVTRDRRDLDAGNVLLLLGDTSRLYMSFFRRQARLMRYDLSALSIDKDIAVPPRAERMGYLPGKNEVLLTLPAASRVARYDAETLDYKGEFRVIFGVRVLAVDPMRRLLLGGSLATGEVAIMDLDTFAVRSRHYLGPWLRTIVVDPPRGIAYVSSNGFLYELKYDQLR